MYFDASVFIENNALLFTNRRDLGRLSKFESFLPLDSHVYPLARRLETAGAQPLARPEI